MFKLLFKINFRIIHLNHSINYSCIVVFNYLFNFVKLYLIIYVLAFSKIGKVVLILNNKKKIELQVT